MASSVIVNLGEACEMHAMHAKLKARSKGCYLRLSKPSTAFIYDWVSAETKNLDGKYGKLSEPQLLSMYMREWCKIFKHVPRMAQTTTLYRAVAGAHANEISALKVGAVTHLTRFSSFAHSPEMVRQYARFLCDPSKPLEPITIICLTVPMGQPFFFVSGFLAHGGFSANDVKNTALEDAEKTQGEVVLEPLSCKKVGRNRRGTLCDTQGNKRDVSVVTCNIQA